MHFSMVKMTNLRFYIFYYNETFKNKSKKIKSVSDDELLQSKLHIVMQLTFSLTKDHEEKRRAQIQKILDNSRSLTTQTSHFT